MANANDIIGIYYYTPKGFSPSTGVLHAGVFYSKVVGGGDRVTYTFDAGPTNKNVPDFDGFREVAKELVGIRDPATPYGKLTMEEKVIPGEHWSSGDIPLPDNIVGKQILTSGFDLSGKFVTIKQTFDEVGSGLYYYYPWLQNSNTVAITALSRASITWDPIYPISPINSTPKGIEGIRPTIMQPFGVGSDSNPNPMYFPGANYRLSTDVTPSVSAIDGVPFEHNGYIYTYTYDVLGQQTIIAQPTEATLALNRELATYRATVDTVNKTIKETWIEPNNAKVDRNFQYSGDGQTPTDVRQEDVFTNGTSTKSVFDTGTEPWSKSTSEFNAYQRIQSQRVDFDNGSQQTKKYDPENKHPYKELDVTKGPDGQITAAQLQLEQNIIAAGGSVGQIFGSALGRAMAPDDPFKQIVAGTVAGLIGQKLLQTFTASLTLDASRFVTGNFASVSGLDIAHAGIGAISSFLTAELGHELHLTGLAGSVFNAGAGGVTASVLTQVVDKMGLDHLSFDAAIGAIQWGTAATQAGYNISSAAGSFLANAFVPAQSHEGAVGGQLFGAVGSALGLSAVLNATITGFMGFLIPGLGSLFGTIVGTMVGDAIHGDPVYPKAYHDVRILGSDYHFTSRLVGTDNHGNAAVSAEMGDQVTAIANSYLDAVHGAGIAYSTKVMTGYNAGAAPYQYITGWFPNGTEDAPHFAAATDAIQQGVRELLRNTEVIGGDLLTKRAHQAFINGTHPVPTEISPDFTDLIKLSGDLSVAQDYQNYLNNREAINALIATNPDTAFSAGWIATFARVNDLGLNQIHGSDFLGGVVGWLDSVNKAGLGAEAANATVKRGGDGSAIVEVKVANGAEVPGALSVFADHIAIASDASGQTVQFTVDSGLGQNNFHFLLPGATAGDGGNDFWIGGNGGVTFTGTGGHDILVGGAGNDSFAAGAGWDFIDGGAGDDWIYGQDGGDILRGGLGNDRLFGGLGDDTYVFNRGDGVDTVLDEYTYMELDNPGGTGAPSSGGGPSHEVVGNAGSDSLVFGPGIAVSDVVVRASTDGHDLIVGVRDPAHPGFGFEQLTDKITLTKWLDSDAKHRIEFFRFADGTTLNAGAGVGAWLVPFGETLSKNSVAEKSAIGTVVGTVAGFDLEASASLSYSMVEGAGGRFAVNASTGVLTVAGSIDYEAAHSHQIRVRVADGGGHTFDKDFTIDVIDIPNHAPVLTVPSSTIKASAGQSLQVASWFSATDADNDALTFNFQDGTTAANSGHFVLNGSALAQGATFGVSAAQLANLTFVVGAEGFPDDLSMQLGDGHAVSAVGAFHLSVTKVIETAGVTRFTRIDDKFYLYDSSGNGPSVKVTAGELRAAQVSDWVALGAERTAGGYEIAWKNPLTGMYGAWTTDANGQYLSSPLGDGVAGNDLSLKSLEPSFQQDLNGDGHIGMVTTVIETAGATRFTRIDDNFYLYDSSGNGPSVKVTAGELRAAQVGDWVALGAERTAGGYEIAWKNPLTGQYGAWTTDANGQYLSSPLGDGVAGNDLSLRSLEPSFQQDLNGDGFIGDHAPVLTVPSSSIAANARQSLQVSSWFSAADADNDALTFHFQDGTTAAGSGQFVLNGTPLGQGASFGLTAAQLAGLTFVASATGVADDVSMQLSDGIAVSAVGTVHVDTYPRGHTDFNGDHHDDILLRHTDGRVVDFQMDGATVANAALVGQISNDWSLQGIGDFNGDGRDDLLWHNTDTRVVEFQMDGATVANAALVGQFSSDWDIQGVGDFNGDGRDDILFHNTDGRIVEFQMNGATIVNAALAAQLSSDWSIQGVGDFNGDGRDDILLHNTDGRIVEFQMDGATVGNAALVGQFSTDWSIKGVGDFNGDGRDDLLFRHTDGRLVEYQMDGATVINAAVIGQPSVDWSVQRIGDFNGDHRDDILLRHTGGTVMEYQMDGATVLNTPAISQQPSTDWHVL